MEGHRAARAYRSPLREAQAEGTRCRITDATLRVLASGAENFTVPAVAKEAGVSQATVYRLFPSKDALAAAARGALKERFGIDSSPVSSVDELTARNRRHVLAVAEGERDLFAATLALNSMPRPATDSKRRRRALSDGLRKDLKGIRGKERRYLLNMIAMLFSSGGAGMLARHGLLNEEGAETTSWAIRALIDAAKRDEGRDGDA